MFVKHLTAVVIMLSVGAGCAASADDEVDPEESTSATGEESQALRREPGPLDYPVPMPVLKVRRDWRDWEVPQFGEELWGSQFRRCVQRNVKIYNPGRDEYFEIPVTVCN